MAGGPIRVAHLISHPIQYFSPLYRELAARAEIDLMVYFYSDATVREFYDPEFGRRVRWDTPLLEGYQTRFCPSAARTEVGGRFLRVPNWDILREVTCRRYEVIWVHGYGHPNAWIVAATAQRYGASVLIREEQTLLHRRPWYKSALKRVALRALFRRTWGVYIGEQSRRYFEHYGMPPSRLFPARYCVDNGFFQGKAAELAPQRGAVRAGLGVGDDAPVVLFCGKFIEKKQPLLLLDAFERVRRRRRCWLLMVGDGPLRQAAEALVERRRIPGVLMPGFLNQTEVPRAYSAADVFVLPSAFHETWGLVVNEAMNFGLPVVVSNKVGCGEDLVRRGWNGFIVDHRDAVALARAIEALVVDQEMRRAFGARSIKLVGEYSISACGDGIVAACVASARDRSRGRHART